MSRQYSLFSSSSTRAKARREKFALTKRSLADPSELNQNQNNSSGEEDPKSPRLLTFPDLPSPTIGVHREDLTFITQHSHSNAVSPLALFTTSSSDTQWGSPKKSPKHFFKQAQSSSSYTTGKSVGDMMTSSELRQQQLRDAKSQFLQFCNKDVSTQCSIAPTHPQPQLSNEESLMLEEGSNWSDKSSQLQSIRPWKSFDWGESSQWGTPPWEPFHPLGKTGIGESLSPSLGRRKPDEKEKETGLRKTPRQRLNEPPCRLDLLATCLSSGSPLSSAVCENCARILEQNKSFQQLKRTTGTNTSFYLCKDHQTDQKQQQEQKQQQIQPITVNVQIKNKTCEQQSVPSSSPNLNFSRGNRSALAFSVPIPQMAMPYVQLPGEPGGGQHKKIINKDKDSSISVDASYRPSVSGGESSADCEGQRGKASTLPTIDSKHILAMRNAEKRRRFFAKKQTNSAPDSYYDSHSFLNATQNVLHTTRRLCGNCKEPVTNCLDGVLRATRREKGDTSTITPPSVEVWESEIRTARCGDVAVTHVSELDYPDADPPCHFCCEQASTAIHDESRLQIVSGGLVRSRDGSTRSGSAPYINLPSPNVQAENGQQTFGSLDLSPSISMSQNLLSPGSHGLPCPHSVGGHRLSNQSGSGTVPPSRGGSIPSVGGVGGMFKEEEETLVGPPASSLTRRPAIVPPKLFADQDYENESDHRNSSGRCSDDIACHRNRRSSIVVIPPMQICPGDLLVYGKVLSQRKSLLGTPIESPSPIPTNIFDTENTQSRKGKAKWSLLNLFERGSRTKGGASGTLEDVMSLIQPCDFSDPKLSRFKGMVWSDFVAHVNNQKTKKSGSVVSSESSSGPSTSSSVNDFKIKENPAAGLTLPIASITTTSGTLAEPLTSTLTSIQPDKGSSTASPPATTTTSATVSQATSSPTKVPAPPPKPLVRKRMGLMRTMSDRCLERRITPALFRGSQGGFLMSEKLVEGKETESGDTGKSGSSKDKSSATGTSQSKSTDPSSSSGSGGGNSKEVAKESEGATTVVPVKSTSDEPDPDHRQKLRQKEALWDLFQSECSFLYDHLMVLKNVFMEPLKRIQVEGFAMYAEPELLFGNLDELCAVTYAFCKEFIHLLLTLTDNIGELVTTEVLCKLFEPSSKARTMSQAYHRYALNYINALNYLDTLRRHVEFGDYEKLCMKDPRCKKLQLTDLLVSPVQHLMKVPLILKDIQSRTNEPKEKELICQILEIQENSIRELDDKMRWLKNFERLLEIQRNIVWPSILEMEPKTWVPDFLRVALGRQPCDSIVVSPRRQIIHEGLLQVWDTGKPSECYVILFDDMLLITRRKKGLSKKKSSLTENWQSACGKSSSGSGSGGETNHRYIVYRQPISLDRFFIHDIGEGESSSAKLDFAFVLVSLNRFQQIIAVHTFQAPAEQIKNTWLLKLKTTQDKWKRTLQTTVFRGVRSSTDSGQSNVASSILGLAHNKSFLHRHNTCESSN